MSIKVFDTKEVQDLLKAAANIGSQDGNARAKEITHRLLSDLFKAIDDLDMTPDEIWAGVNYFNKLGQDGEAALLAAGLGLEKYLDIRMDAADREADIHGGTPRTIEGPLYVAGAPGAWPRATSAPASRWSRATRPASSWPRSRT